VNVRDEIVEKRKRDLAARGHAQGLPLPPERVASVTPFCRADGLICEMKRASPSKGDIATAMSAPEQAQRYADAGARNVSVLTEESYFKGSLSDLAQAKAARPELAFLRKDFLLDEEDLEVSYRFGADAVLLIASLFDARGLTAMRERALSLGMRALVEVHSAEDVDKARSAGSDLTGINSRDLETFRIDPLLPLRVRALIDWETQVIYESGITGTVDAAFAGSCGFDGILVGESVTRDFGLIAPIAEAFRRAPARAFWGSVCGPHKAETLVKVCGLCRTRDVLDAEKFGADILGFILAESSPRRVDLSFLQSLGKSSLPRVGVVTAPPDLVPEEIVEAIERGLLDAIQFHDDSSPEEFAASLANSETGRRSIPFYKALRLRSIPQAQASAGYAAPRVLYDAYVEGAEGGTGKRIDGNLVRAASAARPGLWLAGGLGPESVRQAIDVFKPELVDAASGLEASPGVKDREKLKAFIEGANHG
jgi:indole-3-glycerol phosphate synthase / phosphoribosylanthranilate isomerase